MSELEPISDEMAQFIAAFMIGASARDDMVNEYVKAAISDYEYLMSLKSGGE